MLKLVSVISITLTMCLLFFAKGLLTLLSVFFVKSLHYIQCFTLHKFEYFYFKGLRYIQCFYVAISRAYTTCSVALSRASHQKRKVVGSKGKNTFPF